MVLMSSLLYALTALLSFALGDDLKFKNSIDEYKHRDDLSNTSNYNDITYNNDSNSFSHDCDKCHYCMINILDQYTSGSGVMSGDLDNLNENDVMWSEDGRPKRDVRNKPTSKLTSKKTKSEKKKTYIRVTKYKIGDEVYALRIKEKGNQTYAKEAMCQVYSVRSSFPCDSHESGKIISKISKNNKTPKDVIKMNEQYKSELDSKKQDVESAQVDTYVPSIEDFY